jgi:hypothetical protein
VGNASGAGSNAEMKLNCRKLLSTPQRYESGLVRLRREMDR